VLIVIVVFSDSTGCRKNSTAGPAEAIGLSFMLYL